MKKTRLYFNTGSTTPFVYRPGSSDEAVLKQIFFDADYELNRLARYDDILAEYRRIITSGLSPLIIDCGANIGASSIWFSKSFPEAQVFALEPEQHNHELLHANCSPYHPDITCENAAVSCIDETVFLHDPGEGNWGFRTNLEVGQSGIAVRAISIETIEKLFPETELFLVKIDIEGGESRLFERNVNWIDRAMVIIELHDRLFPCSANSQNFLQALAGRQRDFIYDDENIFSIRND